MVRAAQHVLVAALERPDRARARDAALGEDADHVPLVQRPPRRAQRLGDLPGRGLPAHRDDAVEIEDLAQEAMLAVDRLRHEEADAPARSGAEQHGVHIRGVVRDQQRRPRHGQMLQPDRAHLVEQLDQDGHAEPEREVLEREEAHERQHHRREREEQEARLGVHAAGVEEQHQRAGKQDARPAQEAVERQPLAAAVRRKPELQERVQRHDEEPRPHPGEIDERRHGHRMAAVRQQAEGERREGQQKRPARHRPELDVALREAAGAPRPRGDAHGGVEEQKAARLLVEAQVVDAVAHEVDLQKRREHRKEPRAAHRHRQVAVAPHPGPGAPHLAGEEQVGVEPGLHRPQRRHAVGGQDARHRDQRAGGLRDRVRRRVGGEEQVRRPGQRRRERRAGDDRQERARHEEAVRAREPVGPDQLRDDAVLRGAEERALHGHEEEQRVERPGPAQREGRHRPEHDPEFGVFENHRDRLLAEPVGQIAGIGGEDQKRDGEHHRRHGERHRVGGDREPDDEHLHQGLEDVVVERAKELRGVEPGESLAAATAEFVEGPSHVGVSSQGFGRHCTIRRRLWRGHRERSITSRLIHDAQI